MQKNPKRVFNNVVEAIGYTPMIRLDRLAKKHGIKCQIFAKTEFVNPGQSVKDRIGISMLRMAEKEGKLKPGDTVVECTSGNTGIGLAMACAVLGYKLIITIPCKMSNEKINTLKAFGARVIVCDTTLPSSHPKSYRVMAKGFGDQEGYYWCNQYDHPGNPAAHYEGTSVEIIEQMDGKIDIAFIGTGTFGTMSGNAKRLKEEIKDIKIVGIDPIGSILADPDDPNPIQLMYKAEGLGQTCLPGVSRRDLVDDWAKVGDSETFIMARDIIETEGLLVGGSCGTIVSGMFNYLKQNNLADKEDLICVTLLPDSSKNYMTKFMSNEWMVGNRFWSFDRFVDENNYFGMKTVNDYPQIKPVAYYDRRLTIADCIDKFNSGLSYVPIRENGKVAGVVDKRNLIKKMLNEGLNKNSSAFNCIDRDFLMIEAEAPFCVVQRILEERDCLLLAKDIKEDSVGDVYVLTHDSLIDLLKEDFKELI